MSLWQRCQLILSTLTVVVLLVGCGSDDMSGVVDPPDEYEAAIVLRPLGGGTASPGAVVELVYQVDAAHGLEHELEHWDGSRWSGFLYGVASEREDLALAQGTPWSDAPEDVDAGDIGFEGPGGGLFLALPEDVEGRMIRVCATGTRLCSAPHDLR